MTPEIPCLFSVMKSVKHTFHVLQSNPSLEGVVLMCHITSLLACLKLVIHLAPWCLTFSHIHIPSHIHTDTQTHVYIQYTLNRLAYIGVHIYVHTFECIFHTCLQACTLSSLSSPNHTNTNIQTHIWAHMHKHMQTLKLDVSS